MKTRVAVISIIVEDPDSVEILNDLLSAYRDCVIGRMGIPYRKRGISIICIAVDAPENEINTLTGKIGKLNGITAKINYSNVITEI